MRRLVTLVCFLVAAGTAMAQHGFALMGKGVGENIAGVYIHAARQGDRVRGDFQAMVRTDHGQLGVRGHVVRLAPDATHPHTFVFVAHCIGSDSNRYVVEGVCVDGESPERDKISFTIANQHGPVFRGATSRQVVVVRPLFLG